jgi:hypothetical protein
MLFFNVFENIIEQGLASIFFRNVLRWLGENVATWKS